jgi:1-acyl-sn-glycerol-3-phosphate acyltransferase
MLNALNYLWRLLATGLCFCVFGIGGILMTCLYLPLLQLVCLDSTKRQYYARHAVRHVFHFFISLISLLRLASFSIAQRQELASLKGKLILANHPSLIDVVVLLSIIPNADCVVKAHLFRNPFIRWIIQTTGYIRNNNPEQVLERCENTLAQGNNLIIFPEGTRTTPGLPLHLQRGAANIAVRCKAEVVVLTLSVTPTTLTKTEKWYQIPEKKFNFTVEIKHNAPTPESKLAVSRETRRYTRLLQEFFIEELQ